MAENYGLVELTNTYRFFVGTTGSSRWLKAVGAYSHMAPNYSEIAVPISNAVVEGIAIPPLANRQLIGELLVGQRLDAMATSCWAAKYTLTGSINGSGVLEVAYLSSPDCVVGPGAGPTVTLIVTAPTMTMRFYNPSLTGNVTGCFELKYGWAT